MMISSENLERLPFAGESQILPRLILIDACLTMRSSSHVLEMQHNNFLKIDDWRAFWFAGERMRSV